MALCWLKKTQQQKNPISISVPLVSFCNKGFNPRQLMNTQQSICIPLAFERTGKTHGNQGGSLFDRAGRGLHTPPRPLLSLPLARSVEAHCSARARLPYSSSEECPLPSFQRLKIEPSLRRRHRAWHPKIAGRRTSRTLCFRVERSPPPSFSPVHEKSSLVSETPSCCKYGVES